MLRECLIVVKQVLLSGIVIGILYVSISQIKAVAPDALVAAMFGGVIRRFGPRLPWVAVIGVVLILWWLRIRARGGARGVVHGFKIWLLQNTYSWSLMALVVFAIVVIDGALKERLADLRWLRDAVFLGVDISLMIACRAGYWHAVMQRAPQAPGRD